MGYIHKWRSPPTAVAGYVCQPFANLAARAYTYAAVLAACIFAQYSPRSPRNSDCAPVSVMNATVPVAASITPPRPLAARSASGGEAHRLAHAIVRRRACCDVFFGKVSSRTPLSYFAFAAAASTLVPNDIERVVIP